MKGTRDLERDAAKSIRDLEKYMNLIKS